MHLTLHRKRVIHRMMIFFWLGCAAALIYFQFHPDLPYRMAVHFHTVAELEKAKPQKNILLVFSAWWCGPCQKMKADIFSKKEAALVIEKNFYPVLIDEKQGKGFTPKEKTYLTKYNVSAFPTFIILSPQGHILRKFSGTYHLLWELQRDPATVRGDIYFIQFDPKVIRNPSPRPKLVYISYWDYTACIGASYSRLKNLDPFLHPSQSLAQFVNENFELYEITPRHFQSRSKCNQTVQNLGITRAPAVIVFSSDGKELFRIVGDLSAFQDRAAEIIQYLKEKGHEPAGP